MSAFAARLTDFGDRLNPVLVREVRQALRGRFFIITFGLTLIFAMIASIGVLLLGDLGAKPGLQLFTACSAFLGFAACMLVPIGAFQSLGAEHDDQTRDLLVLSNLSPGQIIRGKFFTFILLALLFAVALAPFLVLSALLNGVDLLQIATVLAGTLVRCVGLTIVAICLSALAPNRGLRALLMVTMILFMLILGGAQSASRVMIGSMGSYSPLGEIAGMALMVLVFGSFAYTLACTRFTHPEENRSTPLRLHITIAVFLLNLVMLVFPRFGSGTFTPAWPFRWEVEPEVVALSIGVFGFASLFFAAEPSSLGRRVRAHVPTSRLKWLAAFAFLPGGGKAVVWFLVNSIAYLVLVGCVLAVGTSPEKFQLQTGVIAICVGLTVVLLPSGVLPMMTRKAARRRWLIALPLLLLVLVSTATEIYHAALFSGQDFGLWRIGSPLGLVVRVSERGFASVHGAVLFYCVTASISVLVNSVRIAREARQLAVESRHRRSLQLQPE